MTSKLETDYYPICNNIIDAATSTHAEISPKPKDVSVCFNCGAF